mmetsp:Transcript_30216/g.41566  ORF Transcript_30216/g.41566 Transcript_30216/m.41566 type:complete len:767 (-) Transcript_30216:185-2485(-)
MFSTGKKSNPKSQQKLSDHCSRSVLYRWWKEACILAWVVFIFFEIIIEYDHMYSKSPLCNTSDRYYPRWYQSIYLIVLGGFMVTWLILLSRIVNSKPGFECVPFYTAINIVSMGAVATILAIFFNWGGVCVDVLGVASPASLWGEWCSSGPLLIFITVTMVDKPDLSKMDWFLIISFFCCIICGFLIIIPQPYAVAMFWLVMSCATYLPLLYLPFHVKRFDNIIEPSAIYQCNDNEDDSDAWPSFSQRFAQRFNLSMWLTLVLPFYSITYFIALFGGINIMLTIAIYQLLSVLTKTLFAAVIMDVHLDALLHTQNILLIEQHANEMRRAFLKYIFHEVRTPLNSLTMGIDLLEGSENFDESDRESLLIMKGASEFMSDTLNDVLSIQKIEEGMVELEMSPFSINDVISKVLLTFRGAILSKNIQLTEEFAINVPAKVIGDRFRIEHVFSNLLSNAIKFSIDGQSIKVEVSAAIDSKANIAFITVALTDEGPGISIENQKKLFANFVQIRPGQLQKGQGSGLGLALCKQLVSLHGGTIGVTSTEGKGSSFHFTIPFAIHHSPINSSHHASSHHSPRSNIFNGIKVSGGDTMSSILFSDSVQLQLHGSFPPTPTNAPDKNPRLLNTDVLVVDDDSSNRHMLKKLLSKYGLEVALAENGRIAVDMVMQDVDRYRLIFMDNLMPIMNGVKAAELLRSNGFKNLIVGITGNVLDDDVREYLLAGADMVLGKPFKSHLLKMLISHVDKYGALSKSGKKLVERGNEFVWESFH